LECWNGGFYVCDRVKFDVPLRIEHASLAIIGGIVPDRLRDALADADDGLAARFIFVWPEPAPIAPLWDCAPTDAAERRSKLEKATERLRALEMGADNHGAPAPLALPLDIDARKLFDEQRQETMQRARVASGLTAGWYGKNPGRLLRLALVYEHLAWAARQDGAAEPCSVSEDTIVRAGGFMDYAGDMLERVLGGLAISRAVADAAQVARYVQAMARSAPSSARLQPLNERGLYQKRGFSWARDSQRRREALAVLRDAGWLRPPQAEGNGRPRADWEVNPRILGTNQ
jgi:hypothetical protein